MVLEYSLLNSHNLSFHVVQNKQINKVLCCVNNFNITNRSKTLIVDRRHYHKVQNEKNVTGEIKNKNYKKGKINYKVELKENTKNRK